jgi:tetratricopeptide (TPR) repeat protein
VQLDPNFALAWARLSRAQAFLYADHAKSALENAQRLEPNSPETLLALGYYQYRVLGDYGLAKTTFKELSKLLPGNSEIPGALGHITQSAGHVDESIAYFEQGLALDPRNMDLLVGAAETYAMLRQFPVAIKLYDRALAVIPNDPELMALKAKMYQAEGNLQESAKLLIDVNERTPFICDHSYSASPTRNSLLRLTPRLNHLLCRTGRWCFVRPAAFRAWLVRSPWLLFLTQTFLTPLSKVSTTKRPIFWSCRSLATEILEG